MGTSKHGLDSEMDSNRKLLEIHYMFMVVNLLSTIFFFQGNSVRQRDTHACNLCRYVVPVHTGMSHFACFAKQPLREARVSFWRCFKLFSACIDREIFIQDCKSPPGGHYMQGKKRKKKFLAALGMQHFPLTFHRAWM